MHNSLQDLSGEIARLRRECDYFLGVLAELEQLSDHRSWLSDEQDLNISSANRTYSWSAKENLERATDDLSSWWRAVEMIITQANTRLGY